MQATVWIEVGPAAVKGKGQNQFSKSGPCLRCGDPNHHYRDCPLPWKEVLPNHTNPQWRPVGKGKPKPVLMAETEPMDSGKGGDNTTPPRETELPSESPEPSATSGLSCDPTPTPDL